MKAKYELEFELGPLAPFDIKKEIRTTFSDGSQIKLYPNEKSKGLNKGAIIFEIDRPNPDFADRIGKDKVNRFLNCMLITKENFEQLAAVRFLRLKFLNPEQIPGGKVDQRIGFTINAIFTASVEENELESVKQLMEIIDTLPILRREIILRSLRWIRSGAEASSEDRFIYRWISFELLLALLEKKGKYTPTLIPEFIHKYMKTGTAKLVFQKHKATIKKLSMANLIGWKKAERSKELLGLLRRRKHDLKAILTKTMLCIYEVRNTLFHKGEALEIMKQSSSLLKDVYRESLKTYIESS